MKYKIGQLLSLRPFMLPEKVKKKTSQMPSANPPKINYMCSLSKSMVNSSVFLNSIVYFEWSYSQFIPIWGIQPWAFRRSNKNLGEFRSFSQLKWAKLNLNSYPLPVGGTEHTKIAAVNLGKGSSTSVKVFSKFSLSFYVLTSMSTVKTFHLMIPNVNTNLYSELNTAELLVLQMNARPRLGFLVLFVE